MEQISYEKSIKLHICSFSGNPIPNLKAIRASVDSLQIESYASETVKNL